LEGAKNLFRQQLGHLGKSRRKKSIHGGRGKSRGKRGWGGQEITFERGVEKRRGVRTKERIQEEKIMASRGIQRDQ